MNITGQYTPYSSYARYQTRPVTFGTYDREIFNPENFIDDWVIKIHTKDFTAGQTFTLSDIARTMFPQNGEPISLRTHLEQLVRDGKLTVSHTGRAGRSRMAVRYRLSNAVLEENDITPPGQ